MGLHWAAYLVGTAAGVRDGEGFAWRCRDGKVTKLLNPPVEGRGA
ncbi:hypothetical protein [Phytohabitans suffuscus]|nr:hypothetical protein [Phytohabitans suffuscus]